MNKIKIGIVDDHEAIAMGLSSELKKDELFEVLFTVNKKEDILPILSSFHPDVLIMDVVMPGSQGIETFKEVLSHHPQLKIIAYTALNSPMLIELLIRTGAKGYLGKNQSMAELKEAVNDVFYDRIHLPEDYSYILKKIRKDNPPEQLSKREVEILHMISDEKKTHEIAELLEISVNTVETHRKHLFEKLHVSNLAGLIKAGIDQGYIK